MAPEQNHSPNSTTDNSSPSTEPVRKSLFSTHWETDGGDARELDTYRQWSILAMLALICGIVSLTAFLYPSCIIIAAFGILLGLIAYFRVTSSQGTLIGMRAALLGLSLSTIALVGVIVLWQYYQYTVRVEADRFLHIWFDAIKAKNIRQIVEMKNPTWYRNLDSADEAWWKSKLEVKGEMGEEIISNFLMTINDPCVKTLWALGDQADISYYRTVKNIYHDSKDTVSMIYAVTIPQKDDPNIRETFFIKIGLERTLNQKDATQRGWAITGFPTVVKELPKEFVAP